MKKIIFVLLLTILGCKKNKGNDPIISNSCSTISSYNDTLLVGNYKLWLIAMVEPAGGSLEVIDNDSNNIDGSPNFSINMVQLQNGNNCWETSNVTKAIGGSLNSYDGTYNGIPSWALDSMTKATIKLTISGNQYFLTDKRVNYKK